jgi:ATP-binding cassette subfamily B protein
VALFVVLVAVFTYWFMRLVQQRYADVSGSVGDLNSRLENNLAGIQVIKAATTEAHEFVTELPDGYDTEVGERGVKLSGGQRQRVAIARPIPADPPIVLFDEATSAVDTETELLIQQSIDGLAADRTTFVVAHRLSTVRDADTVLVVDDGALVERGSHEELIEEDGLYANLWRVQAGALEDVPEQFLEEASVRVARQAPHRPGGEDD